MLGHEGALVADIGTCCMTTNLISPAEVLNHVRTIHGYIVQTTCSVRSHPSETGDRDGVGGRSASVSFVQTTARKKCRLISISAKRISRASYGSLVGAFCTCWRMVDTHYGRDPL